MADPSGYLPTSDFAAEMDRVYGPGNWRQTGGWRSQERENQLRLQGAATVAPGRVSDHSLGTQDSPGARDVVWLGHTPREAAQRLSAALAAGQIAGVGQIFPEGASGTQGGHLHVGLQAGVAQDPWGHVLRAGDSAPPADDPWGTVLRVPGAPGARPTDPWGTVVKPASPPDDFWHSTAIGRALASAGGGAVENIGQIVSGAGRVLTNQEREWARAQIAMHGAKPYDALSPDERRAQAAKAAASGNYSAGDAELLTHPDVAPTDFSGIPGVGRRITAAGTGIAPTDRSRLEGVLHGAGAMAPSIVGAMISPALGAAAFGSSGYEATYQDALAHGASEEEATQAASRSGALNAAVGALPVGAPGEMAIKAAGMRGLGAFAARTANAAASNAALMGGLQAGENVIAEGSYDPDRPVLQGVPEAALQGGLAGGAIHGVHEGWSAVAGRLRPADAPSVPPEAPETQADDGQPPAPPPGPAGLPEPLAVAGYYHRTTMPPEPVPEVPTATVEPTPPDGLPPEPMVSAAAPVPEAPPAPPPRSYEEARVAYAAPPEFMPEAIADVHELREAAPRQHSLFAAIRAIGGIRTVGVDGRPESDVQQLLQGARIQPGTVNNKTGLSPDAMRGALQERGWFGAYDPNVMAGDNPGDNINDLLELMRREASGKRVFHPEDVTPQALARRAALEEEQAEAGIVASDSKAVASAKLAAHRNAVALALGPDMEALRNRAEGLGVPSRAGVGYEELLGDVAEREAIQAEVPSGATADRYERDIDEPNLTPEDHAWLSASERGPRGEQGPVGVAGAAGASPAPQSRTPGEDRPSGARPAGGGDHASPVPAGAELAHIDPRALRDIYDKGWTPFRDRLDDVEAAMFGRRHFTVPVAEYDHEVRGQPFAAHLVANTRFEGRPEVGPLRMEGGRLVGTPTETTRLGGETVEQGLIPGGEASALQAAAAREGALRARVGQRTDVGPLFEEPDRTGELKFQRETKGTEKLRALTDEARRLRAQRNNASSQAAWDEAHAKLLPVADQLTRMTGSPLGLDNHDVARRFGGDETFTPDHPLIAQAVAEFGVTRNPVSAGYVLPDGKMLNFSEEGGGAARTEDHRAVSRLDGMTSSGSDGMAEFMNRTGAVRVDFSSGLFETQRPPTPQQVRQAVRAAREIGKPLILEASRPDGSPKDSLELVRPTAEAVQAFFDQQADGGVSFQRRMDDLRDQYRETGDPKFQLAARRVFYSALERAVDRSPQATAPADQWKRTLTNTPGVKKEELEWTGIHDWLDLFGTEKVPKEAVAGFLRDNGVRVEEKTLGEERMAHMRPDDQSLEDHKEEWDRLTEQLMQFPTDRSQLTREQYHQEEALHAERDALHVRMVDETNARTGYVGQAQYSDWQLPGGQSYRELLLTLPKVADPPATHWDTPGVMAHVRFNERTAPDGKKVLFIEEVQSDWHQKGRDQGYAQAASAEERAEAQARHEAARSANITAASALRRQLVAEEARHPGLLTEAKRQSGIKDDYRTSDLHAPLHLGNVAQNLRELAASHPQHPMGIAPEEGRRIRADLDPLIEEYRNTSLRLNEAAQARLRAEGVEGIPNAPFKTSWPALVMKRMISWAAEHGFDRIAWTTGAQQADRYSLGHHLDTLELSDNSSGGIGHADLNGEFEHGVVRGFQGGRQVLEQHVRGREGLDELIGRELAERLLASNVRRERRAGFGVRLREVADLSEHVGGAGMKAFYDRNLVNITNDLIKKHGGRVEKGPVIITGGAHGEGVEGLANWDKWISDQKAATGLPRDASRADVEARVQDLHQERMAAEARFAARDHASDERMRIGRAKKAEFEHEVAAINNRGRFAKTILDAMEAREKAESPQHGFDLTPALKDAATDGFPLFHRAAQPAADPRAGMERIHSRLTGEPADPNGPHAHIIQEVADVIRRLAPQAEVRPMARIADSWDTGNRISGAQWREGMKRVIAWSLESDDHVQTGRHEALHAIWHLFTQPERAALEKTATDQGWISRYRIDKNYFDVSPAKQLEEAIAHRFQEWRADGKPRGALSEAAHALFQRLADALQQIGAAVRRAFGADVTAEEVFRRIESGEIGKRAGGAREPRETMFQRKRDKETLDELKSPPATLDRLIGEGPDKLGSAIARRIGNLFGAEAKDMAHNIHMGLNPMAAGGERAQATAKDYANALRAIDWETGRADKWLEQRFPKDERDRMGVALDQHGVLVRRGVEPGEHGLDGLTQAQRAAVEEFNRRQEAAFKLARDEGIHDTEGLAFHFPRMGVRKGGGRIRSDTPRRAGVETGNLTTTTGQMRQRKYETLAETDAALKRAYGEDTYISMDIRALNLGTRNLMRAWAGKRLVNTIKAIGKESLQELVSDDAAKAKDPDWFTLPHTALTEWKVRLTRNPETGKSRAVLDENGEPIFDPHPLYMHKSWEGPLRAVLSKPDPKVWRAVMTLKSKAIGAIMYNPLVHNQVIFGKAFPAMVKHAGFGALTFKMYRDGYVVKNDDVLMNRALTAGIVPIGGNYVMHDLGAIEGEIPLESGHGWTSKLVGAAARMMNDKWEQPTKEAMDRFHDFVSNRMLWDQVANLQMGIWKATSDHYQKQGYPEDVADKMAAYAANLYAGAVPREAISALARGVLNGVLFSRSFHQTNIGGVKAVLFGLPSDVRAQVKLAHNAEMAVKASGAIRTQLASTIAIDLAAAYAFRAIAAVAVAFLLHRAIQWPQDNEKGKEDKVLVGTEPDGTAVYMNLPFGKYAGELQEWQSEPLTYAQRIMFGPTREALQYLSNDIGYGHQAYTPHDARLSVQANNFWKFLGLTTASVFPVGTTSAMYNSVMAEGQDQKYAQAQLVGQLSGFTISHGAPGGPAVGDLFNMEDRLRNEQSDAMPAIRAQIKAGDVPGAMRRMIGLGMSKGLREYEVRVTLNPKARITAAKLRQLQMGGTPQEQADFARDRAAAGATQ